MIRFASQWDSRVSNIPTESNVRVINRMVYFGTKDLMVKVSTIMCVSKVDTSCMGCFLVEANQNQSTKNGHTLMPLATTGNRAVCIHKGSCVGKDLDLKGTVFHSDVG